MSEIVMGWAQGRFLTNDSLLNAMQADPVVSKTLPTAKLFGNQVFQEKTFTISANLRSERARQVVEKVTGIMQEPVFPIRQVILTLVRSARMPVNMVVERALTALC